MTQAGRRALRWLRWIVGVPLLLAAVGVGSVYALSEWKLRQLPEISAFDAAIPTDPASIARGRHVARTRGCFGCHGQQLQGDVFGEWDWMDRAVAPALGPLARAATVPELDAAIRHGIGRDGRALWSMPSYNFTRLSDADFVALVAFLRSVDTEPANLPPPRLGLMARVSLVLGRDTAMDDWAIAVPELRLGEGNDPLLAAGEYLAMTTCNECHGLDLRGQTQYGSTPDLSILAVYSDDEFRTLMRTGVSRDGRENMPLMSMIARDRFVAFTDDELDALLAYLRTLPAQPVAQDVFWRP